MEPKFPKIGRPLGNFVGIVVPVLGVEMPLQPPPTLGVSVIS